MGIDPAPFWANLFLYFYDNKVIQSLISSGYKQAFTFHCFIDDLCAINDNYEFNSFFKDIYPPDLELQMEHQRNQAKFIFL